VALNLLNDADGGLVTQAGTLGRNLQELRRLDSGAVTLTEIHAQAMAGFRELSNGLSHYADRLDLDPARLGEIEQRLDLIQSLKRKYGSTLADVIAFGEAAQRKLHSLEQREGELNRINSELHKLDRELLRCGKDLSARRHKLIPKLRKAVEKQLTDLGFRQSHFDVTMTTLDTGSPHRASMHQGLDQIEFRFAPNPGEPGRPLRAIASSGEMARVMLALKTVLAAEDEIPVLVFDEVDANVGGETARMVGEKMSQIARQRQVLCITHLAPVAAHGASHYVVTKEVKGDRTISEITQLDGKSRITELARMLGGQSAAARKHAEELLRA
jgi:DNA repair protein RecN (Recombination protein N)